jgi:hypothetical protein
MSKARLMGAALATAGLLALAGCGGNPQVAVYVGDSPIPLAKVEAISKVLADSSSDTYDTAGAFTPTVMQIMVQSKLAEQVAATKKITVTDDQRQSVYAENELYGVLLKNPVTADFMTSYASTAVILAGEPEQAAYRDLLAATNVRLNPRFGTWDPKTGGIAEGSSGSLSEAATPKQE